MSKLNVTFNNPQYRDQDLINSITAIMDANTLAGMATIKGNESYIHTAYFVYNDNLDLYFLTQPTDQHSQNLDQNPSLAVAIWNDSGKWGANLQGLQLFGTSEQLPPGTELVIAMKLFIRKFHDFSTIIKYPGEFASNVTSRLYAVRVNRIKLLDEPCFGRRNYISMDVKR